jgi:hypothetical protein
MRQVEESDYQWLAANKAETSMAELNSDDMVGIEHHMEGVSIYKNIKLSETIIGENEDVFGDVSRHRYRVSYHITLLTFAKSFSIFSTGGEIALADIYRSYDRKELHAEELRENILLLFEDDDLSIRVEIIESKGTEKTLDTIAMIISPPLNKDGELPRPED